MKPIIFMVAAVGVTGCTTAADVFHQDDSELPTGMRLMSSTAQLVVNNGDGTLCYGPPADATIDLDGSASAKGVKIGAGDNEIPLGGRNPNVLITRDLLFQACLAEARMGLTKAERKKLFGEVLNAITEVNAQSLEGDSVSSDSDSGSQVIPGQMIGQSGDTSSTSTSSSSDGF